MSAFFFHRLFVSKRTNVETSGIPSLSEIHAEIRSERIFIQRHPTYVNIYVRIANRIASKENPNYLLSERKEFLVETCNLLVDYHGM